MGELVGPIPSTVDTDCVIRDAVEDTHLIQPGTNCCLSHSSDRQNNQNKSEIQFANNVWYDMDIQQSSVDF